MMSAKTANSQTADLLEAMAKNKQQQPFVVLPDDVIIVGEKWM